MELKYRHAEIKDLADVYNLYMDNEANPFLTYDPMTEKEFLQIYNSMLKEKNVFVVKLSNEVIGTYRLIQKTNRQSHIVYLGGFTVKNLFKGQGIGFKILTYIKENAQQQSIKRIELTVDTENSAAIKLYHKVGFEIEGKLKNNYRLASTGKFYDEYVMALLID